MDSITKSEFSFTGEVVEFEPVDFCMKCSCGQENTIYSNVKGDIEIKFQNPARIKNYYESSTSLLKGKSTIKFYCNCGNSITLYIKRSRKAKIKDFMCDGD